MGKDNIRTIDTTKTLYYKGDEGNTLSLYITKTDFKNKEAFYLRVSEPIAKEIEEGTVLIYNGDAPVSVEEGVYKVYATETTLFAILDVKEKTTYKCTFLDLPPPSVGRRVIMKLEDEPVPPEEPPTEEVYKCYRCCRRCCSRCKRRYHCRRCGRETDEQLTDI